MIKKTLYFGNPAYLSMSNMQMIVKLPEVENAEVPDSFKERSKASIPIEDIGVVILDNKRITITHGLIEKLLENNVALVTCDSARMPVGLMLPLCGHSTQTEHFREQIEATQPLKKQLWQQTVKAKIKNQATLLESTREIDSTPMFKWADNVKSGDPDNYEAQAAAYFWMNIFPEIPDFRRHREGIPPNNLLNYGYTILRAVIARAIVSSGMLPSLGIFHRNKYNAYCLADDIMEPYRSVVDKVVIDIVSTGIDISELNLELKQVLLSIPAQDVLMNGKRRPLLVAASQTAASLYKCFSGEFRKIVYPDIII
ncbi:type II CRISPR-associated endonuclease Cas1 [Dysgonomonas sp. 521]|uniref:type II CRISPR-associated endonuclease Cas1 n=1 Tax=Dysgonomonas sp. 521 TaxID=2302932 RepID=UPI0013CF643F|nr:type II CRISPR-associated endonuclease Cas1 [Dysgonomonas sp. 521]NDV94356.1 type II CRISPR-associated endonuclease Cas1 [Dysgonomonas sp. 521]